MSAPDLLADLRRRGVKLIRDGDQLRYRAPTGVVTDSLIADLRLHKRELMAELNRRADQIGAVLIDTPRYGQVWLALDDRFAQDIRLEEQHREHPRPVLNPIDVEQLVGRSPEAIAAFLRVKSTFPEATVIH